MEHKQFDFQVSNVSDEGTITGYGSVFGALDAGNDIVLPGAFKKSLAARGSKPIPMLWNHFESFPIGKWTEVSEDERGLKLTGRFTLASPKAQEIHALAKDEVISGLSIGYKTKSAEVDESTGIRRLKELDLWEVSVVTFPMLDLAQIDTVKSDEGSIGIEEFLSLTDREQERVLTKRDARQLSRSAAIALMRDGIPALKAKRDAGDETAAHRMLDSILNDIRAFKGVQK